MQDNSVAEKLRLIVKNYFPLIKSIRLLENDVFVYSNVDEASQLASVCQEITNVVGRQKNVISVNSN